MALSAVSLEIPLPTPSFKRFPALPTELRQQIWLAALHQSLNPRIGDIASHYTDLSDTLSIYRPSIKLVTSERKNRASLFTYKPGLWIPEDIPEDDEDYHPDSHTNLPFRHDLLDDAHFTCTRNCGGGVAALLWTCGESRATILRQGVLKTYGLEWRDAVCDVAYHHGAMDWFDLGVVDRVEMDVDEAGEQRLRNVWKREGLELGRRERNDDHGVDGLEGDSGQLDTTLAFGGEEYKAALVKVKQYYCHARGHMDDCRCHCHACDGGMDSYMVGGDHSSGGGNASKGLSTTARVLARRFDPEADLLFIPACAYNAFMIEKSERGWFTDMDGQGFTTGADSDGVKHVAISEHLFRCVKTVDILVFIQTFIGLESVSIVVAGSAGLWKSDSRGCVEQDVDLLEWMALSIATKGRESKASSLATKEQPSTKTSTSVQAQSCTWRRRQRWEVETLAVVPGKGRQHYSFPNNSTEWHNDVIASHLFNQRHGITDPGYQPPVWQATHNVEGLEALFHDVQAELTTGIKAFVQEATQLIDFEVRIVRAFWA